MLKALVIYLAVVSAMNTGAAIFAFFNGYDAGRNNTREQVYGPGDDMTKAIYNASIAALCMWVLWCAVT